ncbi:MAG: MFS transporter [Candidatus Eisenbacteria bacterium]|nr:MFS transporter [Candidatus Eisenbacteria bacterium]
MKRSTLPIVFLIIFLDMLGFGLIIPILPAYIGWFGAGPLAYGVVLASYSLMQLIFSPLWGRLSDRIGRRPVVLISVVGSVLGFTLMGVARTFLMLLLSRVITGIMNSNIAAAQSIIADITPPRDRAKRMGLTGVAFGLGFVFGPALGGILSRFSSWGPGFLVRAGEALVGGSAQRLDFGAPAMFAAMLSVVSLVLAATLLPETNPEHLRSTARSAGPRAWLAAVSRRDVGVLIVLFFFSTLAQSISTSMIPLFLKEHSAQYGFRPDRVAENTGYLMAFVGVMVAITQGGIIRPLLKVLREPWLIVAGMLLMAISLVWLPYSPSIPILMGSLLFLAVGSGIGTPSLTSLISRRTDAAMQGVVLGAAQSMSSFARFLGPLWGGVTHERLGHAAPYVSGGIFMVLAFIISLTALRPAAVPVHAEE